MRHTEPCAWECSIVYPEVLRGLHQLLGTVYTMKPVADSIASFSIAGITLWACSPEVVVQTTIPPCEFSSHSAKKVVTVVIDWTGVHGFLSNATAMQMYVLSSTKIRFVFHYGHAITKELVLHVNPYEDMDLLAEMAGTTCLPEHARMVTASSPVIRSAVELLGMCAPGTALDVVHVNMRTAHAISHVFNENGLTLTMQSPLWRKRTYHPATAEHIRGTSHECDARAKQLCTVIRNVASLSDSVIIGFRKAHHDASASFNIFVQSFWGARSGIETHACVAPVEVCE
jgi:hypothetical protein